MGVATSTDTQPFTWKPQVSHVLQFGVLEMCPDLYIYIAQGTLLSDMWQPGWEGSLEENGYMFMCG